MESQKIMGICAGVLIGLLIVMFFIFEVPKKEPKQNQTGNGTLNLSGDINISIYCDNGKLKIYNCSEGEPNIFLDFNSTGELLFFDNSDYNYLMINPELQSNKTWDWEIRLICFNSTDIINFKIEYEDYELNYTLETLCETIAENR